MIRCTQCGARKNRPTDPCIYCGAAGDRQPGSNFNRKLILLLLCILIISMIATCILFLAGFIAGDDNAEDLVYTWVSSINANDAEMLCAVFPEIYVDGFNLIPDFATEYLDEYRHELEEEYGEDFHVSAEVLSVNKADDYENQLMSILYAEADIEIEKSKFVEVQLTISGSQKSNTSNVTLNIIRIDGEWYINVLDSVFI